MRLVLDCAVIYMVSRKKLHLEIQGSAENFYVRKVWEKCHSGYNGETNFEIS